MGQRRVRAGLIAVLVGGLVFVGNPGRADELTPAPPAAGPAVVLARLASDPHTPDGYAADLELHVKLHSFPFIGLAVHGTSTFRRPGLYHYQLRNVPHIAANFDDLHYDLGDPTTWTQRYDIVMAPQSTDDAPVLRLTPKHPGGLVTSLEIETDPKRARMLKATWKRRDGGTIVLTQTYTALGSADVVTLQHATIDIPHMRADLTATYRNITLETSTLATVPEH
jgi:hypothetical protein